MDEIGYPPVSACLRAPRVAVAYRPDSGWVDTARRVIQSLSRVWGGAGAVMLPADEAVGIDPGLLGLLRSYDPDVIAGHVPLATDQGLASGDAGPGGSADEPTAWQYLPRHLIDVDPWNDVARLAGQWCSPLKGILQDDHSFQAHEIVPLDRQADSYQYLTVMPPLAGEPPVVALDMSGVDPVVALMIESRIGALDAHDQDRVQPMLLRVEDADLAPLVRMAITGQA